MNKRLYRLLLPATEHHRARRTTKKIKLLESFQTHRRCTMPVELQIIRASEFIRLDPHELLDFAESRKALQLIAHACRKRELDRAVLDLRALPIPAEPLFTPTQLAALVQTFREAGFGKHQRLAVLYRSDPHGGTRAFAFISRIQGWQVRAFEDFEEALLWLSEEAESHEGEVPVRITRRQSEAKKLRLDLISEEPRGRTTRRGRRMTK
jgi:hypothetical protein